MFTAYISVSSFAQAPFTTYQPVIVPNTSRSYSLPDISFPDPYEDMMRQQAAQSYANQVVSSDVVSADGYNIYTGISSPMRIKVIQRRSGIVQAYCLGIKKGGIWLTYDKEIASLEDMYNNATDNTQKSTILELMEYGSFLLIVDIDSEVYVID